jgi:hypothetical protein
MNTTRLYLPLMRQRADETAREAERLGRPHAALRDRDSQRAHEPVTVRLAAPDDATALERLAQLDSARRLPAAPLLIGERAEHPVAALSLSDGAIVANPFVLTADVVALLRLRANQLRRGSQGEPRGRRRALGWRLLRAGG